METILTRATSHAALPTRARGAVVREPEQLPRRLPIGAEPLPSGGVHFRVWAPRRKRVAVVFEDDRDRNEPLPLTPEPNGYFSGLAEDARAGARYRFRLDDDEILYPDPVSRFQPEGPHGPSAVVAPDSFRWSDAEWRGVAADDRVVYEMHVGTFTAEGTWSAAGRELPALAKLGITVIEMLPIADFPGRFGWGYDGVNLFAPTRIYGEPDDLRGFVDRAHALGIAVILDVVYNHLGPDGNYLGAFSRNYFTDRYTTDWGEPFDLDGPDSKPVREYVLANVDYWIREFHFDGFRLDATQAIFDANRGAANIHAEIVRTARAAGEGREIYMVAENEPQRTEQVRPPEEEGYGLDALWNDDWHHSAMVCVTGRKEAYYSDYLGAPQEFVSSAKYGYLYQGQHYAWQTQRRGTPAFGLPATAFVNFLQNHDQVANSARGDRIQKLTSAGELRAMTALLLLGPATPMLFMGQEFAASSPFLYFADHASDLADAVHRGRREFLAQFPSMAQPALSSRIHDPSHPDTFARSKLDHAEREAHAEWYALHADLLRLRREDPSLGSRAARGVDGAVLGGSAFVLRFFGPETDGTADRLLIVNLGRQLDFTPAPEPLLAPPLGGRWSARFSTEDPKYGGLGNPPPESEDGRWSLAGHCALLLTPTREEDGR